jgi:hypothetical protein
MDIAKELVTVLGGTAIAVAALAWLSQSLMTQFLSKDIERHKNNLAAQSALELEKLRAEFARQALEHEVRFRRVDDKVAEHLAEVYQRLFRLFEKVSSLVRILEWSNEPSKEEKLNAAGAATQEFWNYFLPNRIYIPPKLYERVRELANKLVGIANDFGRGLRREARGAESDETEDHWSKAFNAIEKEASPLFTALVRDVQSRLGVEDQDDQVV